MWEKNVLLVLSKGKSGVQQEASLMWKEKFHCGKNLDEPGLTEFLKEKIEPKGPKPFFTPMPKPTKSEPDISIQGNIEIKAESETLEMIDTNISGIQFNSDKKKFVIAEGQMDMTHTVFEKLGDDTAGLLSQACKGD